MSELKPEFNKPFTFKMPISLNDLIELGDTDALADLIDNYFWDKFGEDLVLQKAEIKPVSIDENENIVLEITGTVDEIE